jgi:hypothetical protein
MRKVGVDSRGAYFYLDTGEDVVIDFYGGDVPYDYNTGEEVEIVVTDNKGQIIEDISTDVKETLIAIFGNSNQIRPSPVAPAVMQNTGIVSPRPSVSSVSMVRYANQFPQQEVSSGGLFSGGKIQISSETAFLIGIGVVLFAFGKSRGGR